MTQFIRDKAAATEAQQKLALSFLFAQDSAGLATDGVLTGLAVAQTVTASASVVIGKGAGVVQDSVLNGASMLVLDTDLTLDVLTANPVGGLPRNDLIVFDAATVSGGTGGVRAVIGTPNASPTDPSVPATAIPLARLRHAASATTIPTAKIDPLLVQTSLFGGPFRMGSKRFAWKSLAFGTGDVSGYRTITHGAGFTPTVVSGSINAGFRFGVDNFTSTTFRLQIINTDGSANTGLTGTIYVFIGE